MPFNAQWFRPTIGYIGEYDAGTTGGWVMGAKIDPCDLKVKVFEILLAAEESLLTAFSREFSAHLADASDQLAALADTYSGSNRNKVSQEAEPKFKNYPSTSDFLLRFVGHWSFSRLVVDEEFALESLTQAMLDEMKLKR
jgi:hypothetical protein